MSEELKEIKKAISYLADIVLNYAACDGIFLSRNDRVVLSNLKEGKFVDFTEESK